MLNLKLSAQRKKSLWLLAGILLLQYIVFHVTIDEPLNEALRHIKTTKKIEALIQQTQHQPNDIAAHREIARLSTKRRDYATALEHDRAILAIQPNDNQVHFEVAMLLGRMGQTNDAKTELENLARTPDEFGLKGKEVLNQLQQNPDSLTDRDWVAHGSRTAYRVIKQTRPNSDMKKDAP